jgi:hypothetical protein
VGRPWRQELLSEHPPGADKVRRRYGTSDVLLSLLSWQFIACPSSISNRKQIPTSSK